MIVAGRGCGERNLVVEIGNGFYGRRGGARDAATRRFAPFQERPKPKKHWDSFSGVFDANNCSCSSFPALTVNITTVRWSTAKENLECTIVNLPESTFWIISFLP